MPTILLSVSKPSCLYVSTVVHAMAQIFHPEVFAKAVEATWFPCIYLTLHTQPMHLRCFHEADLYCEVRRPSRRFMPPF